MTRFLPILLALFVCAALPAQAQDSGLLGLWQTEDKDGVVEFYSCEDEKYCGRFYWLEEDSAENPSLDDKNPDPALAKRPLCGMTFLGGFVDTGEGRFDSGWIYSPRHGHMFSANLKLIDNDTLELRGFVIVPLLGGTQTWTRTHDISPCAFIANK